MAMKFCPECEAYMRKEITADDVIIFNCGACGIPLEGKPEDSLLDEEYLDETVTEAIYEQYIENSAFDPAGNRINRPCTKCGLPYMTKIRIGILQNVRFTCTCGNVETR